MGIRALRGGYTPKPFQRRDRHGKHVPMSNRAKAIAEYLAEVQWKATETVEPEFPTTCIHSRPVTCEEGPITAQELDDALSNLKNRKAGGPDETTTELFKALDDKGRAILLGILNDWWAREEIPPETLQARVVHLHKKGKTSDLANYRPLSLLNATYKIFAAIVQKRLAAGMDHLLHETQYGFRKQRSTQHAIH